MVHFIKKQIGIEKNRKDERTGKRSAKQRLRQFTVNERKDQRQQIKTCQENDAAKRKDPFCFFHSFHDLTIMIRNGMVLGINLRKRRINVFFRTENIVGARLSHAVLIFDPAMDFF